MKISTHLRLTTFNRGRHLRSSSLQSDNWEHQLLLPPGFIVHAVSLCSKHLGKIPTSVNTLEFPFNSNVTAQAEKPLYVLDNLSVEQYWWLPMQCDSLLELHTAHSPKMYYWNNFCHIYPKHCVTISWVLVIKVKKFKKYNWIDFKRPDDKFKPNLRVHVGIYHHQPMSLFLGSMNLNT